MSTVPIQFVWVTTSSPILNIPEATPMLELATQLNNNLARATAAFKGTLLPKNTAAVTVPSNSCDVSFVTKDTLSSTYVLPDYSTTAPNGDYTTKSFIKISAPLHDTKVLTPDTSKPISYRNVSDLKRLYTMIHPNYKDLSPIVEKELKASSATNPQSATYDNFEREVTKGKIIVFITSLADDLGLPIPVRYESISIPTNACNCIAISAWTLGDYTTTNTWISDLTVFDRVPWCRNMRGGGALVFGLGTVFGLTPSFDRTCAKVSQKFPNLYVTGYNDSKSNSKVNSNQLLYFGSTIKCPGEADLPYNIMDMSSDDVRYYISVSQQTIVKTIYQQTPGNLFPDITGFQYPPPPGRLVTAGGEEFAAFFILNILVILMICQLLAIWCNYNQNIYYRYINPYGGNVSWWTRVFLVPLMKQTETTPQPTNGQVQAQYPQYPNGEPHNLALDTKGIPPVPTSPLPKIPLPPAPAPTPPAPTGTTPLVPQRPGNFSVLLARQP